MHQTAAHGATPTAVISDDTPTPMHTIVIEGNHSGDEAFSVSRMWSQADAERCRLCHYCVATPGPRGLDRAGRPTVLFFCTFTAKGSLDPDDPRSGEFFSPDGLRP